MLSLEEIKRRLKDRNISAISEITGLSRPTIINLRDGANVNPDYKTLSLLSEHFEAQEAKRQDPDSRGGV